MSDPELLRVRTEAETNALYNAAKKYCGVIYASIFALILAKPEIVHQMDFSFVRFKYVVLTMLSLSIGGIIVPEVAASYCRLLKRDVPDAPIYIKVIVVVFVLVGFLVFIAMVAKYIDYTASPTSGQSQ